MEGPRADASLPTSPSPPLRISHLGVVVFVFVFVLLLLLATQPSPISSLERIYPVFVPAAEHDVERRSEKKEREAEKRKRAVRETSRGLIDTRDFSLRAPRLVMSADVSPVFFCLFESLKEFGSQSRALRSP